MCIQRDKDHDCLFQLAGPITVTDQLDESSIALCQVLIFHRVGDGHKGVEAGRTSLQAFHPMSGPCCLRLTVQHGEIQSVDEIGVGQATVACGELGGLHEATSDGGENFSLICQAQPAM